MPGNDDNEKELPMARYLVLRGPVGWVLGLVTLAISLAAGRRRLRSNANGSVTATGTRRPICAVAAATMNIPTVAGR